MRYPSLVAAVTIFIVFAGAVLPASAANPTDENSTSFLALDAGAARDDNDFNFLKSIAHLVGENDENITGIATYGEDTRNISEIKRHSDVNNQINEAIQFISGIDEHKETSDQLGILSDIYSHLSRKDSKNGSRIYFITTGRILGESANSRQRFLDVSGLFASEGWIVDVLMLPSSHPEIRDTFGGIAETTGGTYYDLGDPTSLISFVSSVTGTKLSQKVNTNLNADNPSIQSIHVSPFTEKMDVLFVKRPEIVSELFSPSGTLISDSMSNVSIFETPTLNIYTVNNPKSGQWIIRGSGDKSHFVVATSMSNSVQLKVLTDKTCPVNEDIILEVSTQKNELPTVFNEAKLEASVLDPGGKIAIYELFDNGYNGDKKASDGIYTVKLQTDKSQGVNDVNLRMTWPGFSSTITGEGTFKTEHFPKISISELRSIDANKGEEQILGVVQTTKADFPFYSSANDLSVLVYNDNAVAIVDVDPVDGSTLGEVWQFNIVGKFNESGEYSVDVGIAGSYMGREYFHNELGSTVNITIIDPPFVWLGMRIWLIILLSVIILLSLLLVIFFITKEQPYGKLTDDRGNVLVDFSTMKRPFIKSIISPGVIPANEIVKLPFSGGVFVFRKGRVIFENKPNFGDPSIRINGMPSPKIVYLAEDVTLGAAGRLMKFIET